MEREWILLNMLAVHWKLMRYKFQVAVMAAVVEAAAAVVPDSTIISLYLRQIINKCQTNLVIIMSPLQTIANQAVVSIIHYCNNIKVCSRLLTTYIFFKVMIPAIVVVVAAAAEEEAEADRGTIEEAVLMGML